MSAFHFLNGPAETQGIQKRNLVTQDGRGIRVVHNNILDEANCSDGKITNEVGFSSDYLAAGTLLGRLTSNGKLCVFKGTSCDAVSAAGQPVLSVTESRLFAAGDQIDVGGTTYTILSIDYTLDDITLTANLAAATAVGDAVVGAGAQAGAGDRAGVLLAMVAFADSTGTRYDQPAPVAKSGEFLTDSVVGDANQFLDAATQSSTETTFALGGTLG